LVWRTLHRRGRYLRATALHHSFAIREADAGKHIIKENPLTAYFGADGDPVPIGTRMPRARMREGARNNTEAVRRNGVKFCYAENWITRRRLKKMRRLIGFDPRTSRPKKTTRVKNIESAEVSSPIPSRLVFSLRQIQALQAGAYRAEEHRDRFAQVLKLQHGRAC
jgi:hypothetical protein